MTDKLSLPKAEVVRLHLEEVVPDPNQPRESLVADTLKDLAQSLLESGQISPLVVRPTPEGKYMIVVGERRWRAAKEAGFQYIDCIIRDDLDDRTALEMQLAENCQREDIAPLDQARAFKACIDKYKVSQRELARRTGIPQRTISARLALLSLPMSMHAHLKSGVIGPYEALRIAELPADQQEAAADAVASGRIGSRTLEKLVDVVRTCAEKSLELIIGQLTSTESSAVSLRDTPDVSMLAAPATPDASSQPKTTSHEKRKTFDLENKPAFAKLLSEMGTFLDIAKDVGSQRRQCCRHLNAEEFCDCWSWESEESIPEGMGEPLNLNDEWFVRPSVFLCALCTYDLLFQLDDLELEMMTNPCSGLKTKFNCTCGSSGKVAVAVKCTKCGRETWWGSWPKRS